VGAEPNLILNLGQVVRQVGVEADFLPEVQYRPDFERETGPELGGVSIDAVAAAVRETFMPQSLRIPPQGEVIVTGALLLAMTVADHPAAVEPHEAQVPAPQIQIRPPWEITHPVLLDPVMWLVATAYHVA